MNKIARIPKVVAVEVVPPFGLRVAFDDGVVREVDMAGDLWGGLFEPIRVPAFFALVTVDHGTVVWPNGLGLDPLVLHGDFVAVTSATAESAGSSA